VVCTSTSSWMWTTTSARVKRELLAHLAGGDDYSRALLAEQLEGEEFREDKRAPAATTSLLVIVELSAGSVVMWSGQPHHQS